MNATKISGIVAAVSGAGLLVLALGGGIAGAVSGASSVGAGPFGAANPMGAGTGSMSGGGMMGQGGMGPGMMNGWGGTSTSTSSAIPGAPEVRVSAGEFALLPAEIVLPAGTAVNVTLENKGALPHDLTIPALGVRIVAAAGQTQTAGLRDLPAGSYPAYCAVPGHAEAGMRATVVVR